MDQYNILLPLLASESVDRKIQSCFEFSSFRSAYNYFLRECLSDLVALDLFAYEEKERFVAMMESALIYAFVSRN